MSQYPIIGQAILDDNGEWVVEVERAPGDTVAKRFQTRTAAREAVSEWRKVMRIVFPKRGLQALPSIPVGPAPRTKKELMELLSATIQRSQAGELPMAAVQPIIQLAKMQLKLMDMKDPEEEDLRGLSEVELLDRIFEQLTTEELLALARERLDVREQEVKAA